MKREIKFRAWNEVVGMITTFDTYQLVTDCEDGSLFCGGDMPNGDWEQPELMQYTGLKDKNGVEIYEGDIIRYNTYGTNYVNCVVVYSDNYFKLKRIDSEQHAWITFAPMSCDVIGNIHENSELLNPQKT